MWREKRIEAVDPRFDAVYIICSRNTEPGGRWWKRARAGSELTMSIEGLGASSSGTREMSARRLSRGSRN